MSCAGRSISIRILAVKCPLYCVVKFSIVTQISLYQKFTQVLCFEKNLKHSSSSSGSSGGDSSSSSSSKISLEISPK
jgi:hypothetical protein